MNVLMLSKDPSLFERAASVAGDTRARHVRYAEALSRRTSANSRIRIIGYAPRRLGAHVESLPQGLMLIPTDSVHRATYLMDVVRLLPSVLRAWRPNIVTVQSPWEEGFVGYVVSRALGAAFLPQLHVDVFSDEWRREAVGNAIRQRAAAWLLGRAEGVRVVSRQLKAAVVGRLGIPPERVHVAPVGVDFHVVAGGDCKPAWKARLAETLVGHPVVLFVGRFCSAKNLPLWLEVASRIAAAASDVRFVMVGDGPLLAQVRARGEQLGLGDKLLLPGQVSYRRLPEVFAAADVLLLTSDHEALGRVIVEAFLSGVPVVSTSCAGPSELVRDGVSGVLRPIGDAAGLAQGVLNLLGDPARAAAAGAAGKMDMQQTMSQQALIERLIDTWIAVVSDSRRGRRARQA